LGLAYLAGALKKAGHDIQVIDATADGVGPVRPFKGNVHVFGLSCDEIIERVRPDTELICFSFMFTNNWLHDRKLVRAVSETFPLATLVAGGEHVTAAPEFCLNQAPGLHYLALGEGENTIVTIASMMLGQYDISKIGGIAYRKEGRIVLTPKEQRTPNIETIAWPAWEYFPVQAYFDHRMSHGVYRGRTLPVMASRGCPYECTFCSSPQMWGRKYQIRSPKDFVDELEHLHSTYGVVNFDLYDLTAIIYRDWTIQMCNEIIERDLHITFQLPSGTRSEAIDKEVSEHLFRAGCKNITYAPESGSQRMLKIIKKKVKIESMLKSISESSSAGLNIHLNMIIGFPEERHSDLLKTLWFLIRCSWHGANDVAIAVFTPYPGSDLFERLSKDGRVNLYDDESLMAIIDSYDLWPSTVYSTEISPLGIKWYVFLLLVSFYASNYLFRPIRLIRTFRNVTTGRHESRLEQILYKNFFKSAIKIQRS